MSANCLQLYNAFKTNVTLLYTYICQLLVAVIRETFHSIKSGGNPIKIQLNQGNSWEIRVCWLVYTVNAVIKSSAQNTAKTVKFHSINANKNRKGVTLAPP